MKATAAMGASAGAALLVGLAAGWTLARISGDPQRADSPAPSRAARSEPEQGSPGSPGSERPAQRLAVPASGPSPATPTSPGPPASERLPGPEATPLFHAGLVEHGRAGLRAGWRLVRQDEIPPERMQAGLAEYEALVSNAPRGIGVRLAQAQDAREAALQDAATGGVFALLESLSKGDVDSLPELVGEPAAFDALFQREAPERVVDGTPEGHRLDEGLEDGSRLSFPAGVFRLRGLMQDKRPFPRDVTVQGAGMNLTLLVGGELDPRGQLRNFTLRDCTLFTDGDYAFSLRTAEASLQFERVRICGFDSGTGGSCMLSAPAVAFRASGCQFLGGYGHSPSSGHLFRVRGALVGRLEACDIEGVFLDPVMRGGLVFAHCRLRDLLSWGPPPASLESKGVQLVSSSLSWLDASQEDATSRDLNDLFPGWRERLPR